MQTFTNFQRPILRTSFRTIPQADQQFGLPVCSGPLFARVSTDLKTTTFTVAKRNKSGTTSSTITNSLPPPFPFQSKGKERLNDKGYIVNVVPFSPVAFP